MSYLVKYDDVTSVGAYVNGNCQTYGGQLQEISQSFTNIVGIPSLKGQAADSMKAYVGEVHGFIIQSISQLVQEIQSKFLLYKDGYYNTIDADNHAKLDENILESTLTFFRQSTNNFDIEHGKLEEVIQSVYDIINVSNISAYAVQDDYQHTTKQVSELKQLVGQYENDHATKDFTVFDAMLTSLKGLIAEAQAKDSAVVTHYQPRDLLQYKDSVALNGAVVASQESLAANQTALDQAITNEGKRWEVLEQEAADKRAEDGIWNAVFAVGAVIIGGAAIVLTAGAATPLVVTAAIAGSASIAYGASNLVESSQDIYFGLHGDATTAAFNPLRDTVFMGNQGAYDAFGMVATTVAGACIPMGPAIAAAKAGGTSVVRATVVTLGKEATSVAVGSGAFFATEHFVAPIATDLFGEDIGRNVTRVSSIVAATAAGGFTMKGLTSRKVPTISEVAGSADEIPQIRKNAAQGKLFEEQEFPKFAAKTTEAVEQITIKTTEGTKVRVDAIGLDKQDGSIAISEFKSSDTAPLTPNQKVGFGQLQDSGGVVVGKGKGIFTGGFEIPAGTKVDIVRPPK
ncbi:T7SS effector LXG polymorphic toxin [Listeria riparia]|uniref:Membrane protein n=1 Tax=Listeria riparia FSL S10-1204 TaxID=1265816 RepID=W7CZC3_9LIST|nr:T7SS effector LXG polymorphic toxin [Listeria riparia]EUJ44899.1 membrane protein [Listeria riparia FSL S10-1204]